MPESIMLEKAKIFAIDIVNVCKEIKSKYRESVLTNQLIRSGTSIGANIHESKYAHGTADFIAKMQIALKECYESEYWLELLFKTNYLEEDKYKQLQNLCGSIRRMLISSINTVKKMITGIELINKPHRNCAVILFIKIRLSPQHFQLISCFQKISIVAFFRQNIINFADKVLVVTLGADNVAVNKVCYVFVYD